MAEKKVATPKVIEQVEVIVHLDKDPNDPRNVKPAEKLPSLNDDKKEAK